MIHTTCGAVHGAFLIMSGLINGAFAALDAILFYVFFEAMLIPMYLIIGVWAARAACTRRSSSSCTPAGFPADAGGFLSTCIRKSGGSFEILKFHTLAIPLSVQITLFVGSSCRSR